jgi:hypothetical protein
MTTEGKKEFWNVQKRGYFQEITASVDWNGFCEQRVVEYFHSIIVIRIEIRILSKDCRRSNERSRVIYSVVKSTSNKYSIVRIIR